MPRDRGGALRRWAVVIEEGNAETETVVTVGGTTVAEIEMEMVPDFAESCFDWLSLCLPRNRARLLAPCKGRSS